MKFNSLDPETIYIFFNKRRNQVKLSLWEKDGHSVSIPSSIRDSCWRVISTAPLLLNSGSANGKVKEGIRKGWQLEEFTKNQSDFTQYSDDVRYGQQLSLGSALKQTILKLLLLPAGPDVLQNNRLNSNKLLHLKPIAITNVTL